MEFDKELQEKLNHQKKLFRELVGELNNKVMDYESCRMLEDFLNDYSKVIILELERAILKIKEDYDLLKKK